MADVDDGAAGPSNTEPEPPTTLDGAVDVDSEDEFYDAESDARSEADSNTTPSANESIPDLEDPTANSQFLDLDTLVLNESPPVSPPGTTCTSFSSLPRMSQDSEPRYSDSRQWANNPFTDAEPPFPQPASTGTDSPLPSMIAPPPRRTGKKSAQSSPTKADDAAGGNEDEAPSPAPPPRKKKGRRESVEVPGSPTAAIDADADALNDSPSPVTPRVAPLSSPSPVTPREASLDAESVDPALADIKVRRQRSKTPTDDEILSNVMLTCLDTGESVPMSRLHELLPEGLNPLAFTVIERTGEFSADQESLHEVEDDGQNEGRSILNKLKTAKDKTLAAASAAGQKAKALGDKLVDTIRRDDERVREEQEREEEAAGFIKMRTRSAKAQQTEGLRHLTCAQDLSSTHIGAIWTMKMSTCGRLLATAGQDKIVRVWVVKSSYEYFKGIRTAQSSKSEVGSPERPAPEATRAPGSANAVFHPQPFAEYSGHTADVLDLAWCHSKNFFLLSSSMDKTVRLWHVSRGECLASFLHEDFVTAIAFHPRNDKYFLSGSLDCKLRLWNIPEKKVALWNEVGSEGCNLITAATFCSGGKYAVAGTYDGRCVFFNTEERLKYHTQIHARSSRGKNSKGRKISGIEAMPGSDKILVTSNDSRVRLFDLKDHSLSCKYKGAVNTSSQIKSTFSPDGSSIVCGSEDHQFYTWDTEPVPLAAGSRKKGWRRDRNDEYQRFSAHQAVVTVAMFAHPNVDNPTTKEIMLSADYSGAIKVYAAHVTKPRPNAADVAATAAAASKS